jgi:prepilin-type N-terminal cleavage/methylation domain-containing protein
MIGTSACTSRKQRGFTLIELLVVVVVIAIISGLLLPVLIQAADRARRAAQDSPALQRPLVDTGRPALPSGPAPILDSVDLTMTLTSSYHRIGMDVITRYRVDCAGRIEFRDPGGSTDGRVMLIIPFPDNILEARDVQLKVVRPGTGVPIPLDSVVYNRHGIYCSVAMEPNKPLTAELRYTALGREQLEVALPPARQLKSVSITLNLPGAPNHIIPDDSVQPSAIGPNQLRWEFKNLVSDRRIIVQIPGAEAPLARMLLLSRLVAIAVLLFGAGFGYLSEQVKPGQLQGFRLGHFLLLALTYSLFFVIFAVLEFHGSFSTPVSMAVSAAFSLPLLVLHTSRVLNLRFAIVCVVPLALFTLGLVINGVYGGAARDYVFIGATIFVITYSTLNYQAWTAGRERYRREQNLAYRARRGALAEAIDTEIAAQVAVSTRAGAYAAETLSLAQGEAFIGERSRLERSRDAVAGLNKENEEITKRLSTLPVDSSVESSVACAELQRDVDDFRARLAASLATLHGDTAALQASVKSVAAPVSEGTIHCLACGDTVPDAPYCQNCGAARAATINCAGCGERIVVPIHLLAEGRRATAIYCPSCGTRVPLPPVQPSAGSDAGKVSGSAAGG